ncbi:hyaluronan synthase [Algimonas ampicilliniresistens]|uniref:Hyaluronan synthase n=1 Tax=Algimonas ampicilliniresistens TaxID=1298735 RepID=A0ABQ5VAC5_9PROT|nr:hydrogen peroxide-inducible genes activator [Algimonas ampicilliniresistens]GLQ23768.1 hyaluronan synthase [Algimonas ampicilliniresistens]
MKPTLRQLQYLVAIDEAGTFSGAAKLSHVSQPSLSTQLRDMEEVLDTILVERGRGGAPLTPIGQELAGRARIILRDMDAFRTLAREAGQTLAGRIRLGTLPSIGPYLLPLAVRRLHKLYPELRIVVREERTVDLQAHLEDGRLDVVISTPEDHRTMRHMKLFRENLFIGVAPDDPLARESGPVSLTELSGRDLLTLGYGHKLSVLVGRLAEIAGAQISSEYEGTSLDAVRQMAAMGGSVAVLPSLYTRSEAREDPGLVIRRIEAPEAIRDIALLWRPTSPLSPKFQTIGHILSSAAEALLQPETDVRLS